MSATPSSRVSKLPFSPSIHEREDLTHGQRFDETNRRRRRRNSYHPGRSIGTTWIEAYITTVYIHSLYIHTYSNDDLWIDSRIWTLCRSNLTSLRAERVWLLDDHDGDDDEVHEEVDGRRSTQRGAIHRDIWLGQVRTALSWDDDLMTCQPTQPVYIHTYRHTYYIYS